MASVPQPQIQLPRVAISFCVQCKWNLRAAYYAQELLQTFSNALGEVALIPVTGGIFIVKISYSTENESISDHVLWDRKTEGGFPETKELKNRVRNIIEPGRDLGHIDRSLKKGKTAEEAKDEEDESTAAAGIEAATPVPMAKRSESKREEVLNPAVDPKCEDCK